MSTASYPAARRSERQLIKKAVILLVESEGENVQREASTVDLSSHGTRVKAGVGLAPGQIIDFMQGDSPASRLRCRVVWVGEVGSDREGEAGLEFLNPKASLD